MADRDAGGLKIRGETGPHLVKGSVACESGPADIQRDRSRGSGALASIRPHRGCAASREMAAAQATRLPRCLCATLSRLARYVCNRLGQGGSWE
jgi:hypothetical protein